MPAPLRCLPWLLLLALAAWGTGTRAMAESLVLKGSDTLGAKIIPQLAEAFKERVREARGEEVAFEIAAEGSSTGVAATIDGTADIGMSSRPPSPLEIAEARSRGVRLQTIAVAQDSVAVIVNRDNPLNSLSLDSLEAIFTGDVRNWAALSELPGQISVYTRNTSSGTYATFRSLAMSRRDYGPRTQKMAGNEQIAAEVARNPHGIGYVGLAYARTPGVKVVRVNAQLPDQAAYPLVRPVYFLIDASRPLDPLPREFIDFVLSPEGQRIIKELDFLPAPAKVP